MGKIEITVTEKGAGTRRLKDKFSRAAGAVLTETVGIGLYAALRTHKFLHLPEGPFIRMARDEGYYDPAEYKAHLRQDSLSMQDLAALTDIPDLQALYNAKPEQDVVLYQKQKDGNAVTVMFRYDAPRRSLSGRLLDMVDTKPGFSLELIAQTPKGTRTVSCPLREFEKDRFTGDVHLEDADIEEYFGFKNRLDRLAFFATRDQWLARAAPPSPAP